MHKRDVQAFYRIADDAALLGPEGEKIAARIRQQLRVAFKDIDDVVARLHDLAGPLAAPSMSCGFVTRSLPPGDQ
jgi:hypothetical protein